VTGGLGGMPPPPQNAPAGQQATGGVQPGQSTAIVFANKVIVFGAGDGVFVYPTGTTPALGNPPIAWMGGGLVDPYGNVLPSTTGVAGAGTFQAGDTRITTQGLFTYSGTPALGNLIYSDTSAAGTDPFGNVVLAGANAYLTLSGKTYAVGLNTLSGTGLPGLSIGDTAHPPTSPAGFFGEASSASGTPQAFAAITSGQANGTDVASFISILSQLQSAVTGGQIVLQAGDIQFDVNGNLADWTVTAFGVPQVTQTTGDGNTYKVGRKHYTNSTINVTSAVTPVSLLSITGLETSGAYHIRGFVTYLGNQAAGAPILSWGASGGLVLAGVQDGYQRFFGGGVAPVIHNNIGALGAVTGPVFAAATTNWLYDFEIYVTVNTAGALLVTGLEGTAGDSWTVSRIYAVIEPF
jgi:hypothetical protein